MRRKAEAGRERNTVRLCVVLLFIVALGVCLPKLRSLFLINKGHLTMADALASPELETHRKEEALDKAIADFALVSAPHSARGHYALAVAQYFNGEYQSAVGEIESARRYTAKSNEVDSLYLGFSLEALGKHAEAISAWEDARGIAVYFRNRGGLVNSPDEKLKWIDLALEIDPTLAGAHYLRGTALLEVGEVASAKEAFFREITDLEEHAGSYAGESRLWDGSAFMQLGYLYSSQGTTEEALRMFVNGLLCGHPDAPGAVAWVVYKLGGSGRALQFLREHMKENPVHWQDFVVYGDILKSRGDVLDAIDYYCLAISIAPEKPGLRIKLADAYARLNMCDEARGALEGLTGQSVDPQSLNSIWERCP